MLFAHKAESVAVVGYGAGITTGNILLYPGVKRINVFELEPGVIGASKYFEHVNRKPLEDRRTHLFTVDGRSHITYENFNYDVITSDPIHPVVAGAANLYTQDFYQIARTRLKPGGIFCQWIPLVAISPDSYNVILNTLHSVFPHMALFSFFGESVVLASTEPLRIEWKALEKRFYAPQVYEDLKALDFQTPFNLMAFYLGGEQQIDQYLSHVALLNTDDNVWLEHHIPMDMLDLSHGNLYFWLKSEIKPDNRASLKQIFSGLPLSKLDQELAALSKDGDSYYEKADRARMNKEYSKMEEYYRYTFSDFNSQFHYRAGLKLAKYLGSENRIEEALAITKSLQTNYPAFPDAYLLAAQIRLKAGMPREAQDTLKRGLMYNPDHSALTELLAKEDM